MALKIIVCIKPVPDPAYYEKVTIDPITKRITREGIPTIINPVDKTALEAALRLKETFGGRVVAMTMSMPAAETNLREALAMGADEAILLTDKVMGGADTLATAYTLAEAIKKTGDYDLILTGAESADGATAQVSAQLGEWLGVPHLWNVFCLEAENEECYRLKTKLENGHMEWEGKTPMVLGLSREAAKPRYISAIGIIKAKSKPLITWGRADLETAEDRCMGLAGSPTHAGEIKTPDLKRKAERISGSPEEIAAGILERLRAGGAAIGR